MAFKSRNAVIPLLAFMVIGALINATNAKPPSRIIAGENANLGDFKWMVGLSFKVGTVDCGGAIISPRHILTAAHCIANEKPSDLFVLSGIVDLGDENVLVNSVARLVVHPKYVRQIINVTGVENDIGIVVLNRDLKLDGRLSSIPLPTKQPGRQLASLCGWGDTSENAVSVPMILQATQVQVVEDQECLDLGYEPYSPQFLCGYQENGAILDGDSGSPLVSGGQIIGVASSGLGVVGVPDSYVNVYYYRQWIKFIMRQSND